MEENQPKKKKVFIQTDFVLAKTGFGKNAKAIFEYLYKTGKYELINLAVGSVDTHIGPEATRTPWKTVAAVNEKQLESIKKQNDPRNWEGIEKMAGYGAYQLNDIVKKEQPDVFIAIQDIWGIDFAVDSQWFKKIKCALWTTLDSLPILPKAVELAPKVENYWCWADFATKALNKLGHKHVKTLRGALNTSEFHRFTDHDRKLLRKKHNVPEYAFVIGFVFRNQLRKSVPNLIQGYKQFKAMNPKVNTRLYLHTCWVEGWDIPKLLKEHEVNQEEVLTSYICKECRAFHVKPYKSNDEDCPHCKAKKTCPTTHPSIGITEKQLNEVYNLMDVYCHPFTSGGQEIPIQEAKLTELITLVTNYSCGEDCCYDEAASLPLEWAEYREPGTQFIKASTQPFSIAKQLNKVLNMKEPQRREMGRKARKWVIDNFSIEVIGKKLEEFIDSAPFSTPECFDEKVEAKDPYCTIPHIEDSDAWIAYLYKHILKMDVPKEDDGFKHWQKRLADGMPRQDIERYFRQVAFTENQKQKKTPFEDFLNKDDKGRVLVVQPESAGDIFLLTSLFKSIKERYPDWALYVATKPEYKEIIDGNPYVSKWLEYHPMMDSLIWLEGNNNHDGYFDIAYLPYAQTQKFLTYMHNGKDKLDFKIQ